MGCRQEIHKLISRACRPGLRWDWLCPKGEWTLVHKILALSQGAHAFHGKVDFLNPRNTRSFQCGSAETNLASIHEDVGLIPGLHQ